MYHVVYLYSANDIWRFASAEGKHLPLSGNHASAVRREQPCLDLPTASCSATECTSRVEAMGECETMVLGLTVLLPCSLRVTLIWAAFSVVQSGICAG
jgi:hypothetical protein